jgi:hypothetical protein
MNEQPLTESEIDQLYAVLDEPIESPDLPAYTDAELDEWANDPRR